MQYLYVLDNWKGVFEGERNEALTLDWAYRVRVPEQRVLPPGMIPIGCDPGGSQFVLEVEGKLPSDSRPGSVWFWASDYHDRHRAASDPFHSLGFIAVSFSDFLAKIHFEDL